MDNALEKKIADLEVMTTRLSLLPAHAALFLIKNALAIPKLIYVMRTAPYYQSKKLMTYDNTLKASLASLLNVELTDTTWNQLDGAGLQFAARTDCHHLPFWNPLPVPLSPSSISYLLGF